MLTIRLQRTGTKNKPAFRVVLAESLRSAKKKVKEVLGSYNPRNKQFLLISEERIKKLISINTDISPTVYNLLVDKGLIIGKKVKAWQPKKKEKAEEKSAPAEVKLESVPAPVENPVPTETPRPSETGEARPSETGAAAETPVA